MPELIADQNMIGQTNLVGIKRALVSVSDKTGVADFCGFLQKNYGTELLSTGGTAKLLAEAGLKVKDVSEYTGFPEMMSGRVKTLHPKVHGGILGRRGYDTEIMKEHGIEEIDLVLVNLYPFESTIKREDVNLDLAIENIDIGGPTMLRSAAKNWKDVAVICDPKDYARVQSDMESNNGKTTKTTRFHLCRTVYEHTARYDAMIASWLSQEQNGYAEEEAVVDDKKKCNYPDFYSCALTKHQECRYGENPHQTAALYVEKAVDFPTVALSKQLQGKELSYNNIADSDAALECALQFGSDKKVCVIVKHANPCGVAVSETSDTDAYEKAFKCDTTSAFGGIIAFNCPMTKECAEKIVANQFVEVIMVPSCEEGASEAIAAKKNVRLLQYDTSGTGRPTVEFKKIMGGLLVQSRDYEPEVQMKVVTKKQPTEKDMKDMLFAWKVAQMVKSNAIVYAKDEMTYGIGAGQMSRVFSSKIAVEKAAEAKLDLTGAVCASDAFFPFRDGLDTLATSGCGCVIQPGGSMRDQEVIDAADEHGIAMVFTGCRHFKH